MLPKANRLKNKKDFEQVFKKGRGFRGDFLLLKLVGNNLAESRFGIIVSQKVSKRAAARNKIKRRIRAAINRKLPKIKKGIDVILAAAPGLENKDFQGVRNAIDKIFEKAEIVKE